jgi:yeast amino acid transporter
MFQPNPNAQPEAEGFFMSYLALPIVVSLYAFWKVWSRNWRLYVPLHEVDIHSGAQFAGPEDVDSTPRTWANLPKRIFGALF